MHNRATKRTLSAAAASAESGIPKRTVLYAIERGHLRATLFDGLGYVIKRRDFERWLAERERKSA